MILEPGNKETYNSAAFAGLLIEPQMRSELSIAFSLLKTLTANPRIAPVNTSRYPPLTLSVGDALSIESRHVSGPSSAAGNNAITAQLLAAAEMN